MSETPGEQQPATASVATDNQGWFKAVSPAFLTLIDQPVEALAGVNLADLVHPMDAPLVRQLLSGADSNPLGIVRVLGSNDRWLPHQVRTSLGEDGRVTVVLTGLAHEVPAVVHEPPTAVDEVAPVAATITRDQADAELAPSTVADSGPIASSVVGSVVGSPPAALSALGSVPNALAGDFPYADSVDHMDYVGSRPPVEVSEQRAAVRQAARDDGATALLELDRGGRVVFITGDWDELLASDAEGVEAFEEVLAASGQGPAVVRGIERVLTGATTNAAFVRSADSRLRAITVRPIPSPLVAGRSHALVSVGPAPVGPSIGELTWTGEATSGRVAAFFDHQQGGQTELDEQPGGSSVPADDAEANLVSGDTSQHERGQVELGLTDEANAEGDIDGEDSDTTSARNRPIWPWVLLGAGVLLVGVWLLQLGGGGEAATDMGPIDIEIVTSDPVETISGQSWRALGVGGISDVHGVATFDGGAFVAGTTGRIVRVDNSGAALSAVQVGDVTTTAISDLIAADDGTAWALDAGLSQLYRISPDGEVKLLEPGLGSLTNARGISLGSDNTVWVASTASGQLVRIGRDGGVVGSVAMPGRQPSDVVELDDGTLWFVDAELIQLVHVTPEGEIVRTVEIESFFSNEAPHLAVADGLMWVTDPIGGAVFAIDLAAGEPTGERIEVLRAEGARAERPIGLAIDSDDRIWTVDSMARATVILDN